MKTMQHLAGGVPINAGALKRGKRRRKNCALTISQEQQVCKLYQQGWNGSRLAVKYEVTKQCVYKILNYYRIRIRGRGRQKNESSNNNT